MINQTGLQDLRGRPSLGVVRTEPQPERRTRPSEGQETPTYHDDRHEVPDHSDDWSEMVIRLNNNPRLSKTSPFQQSSMKTDLRQQSVPTHEPRLQSTTETPTTSRCTSPIPISDRDFYTYLNPNGGPDPIQIRLVTPNHLNDESSTQTHPVYEGVSHE